MPTGSEVLFPKEGSGFVTAVELGVLMDALNLPIAPELARTRPDAVDQCELRDVPRALVLDECHLHAVLD